MQTLLRMCTYIWKDEDLKNPDSLKSGQTFSFKNNL